MAENNKQNSPEAPIASQNQNQLSVLTGEEKIFAALGYVSVACFLPLAMKPKSVFCQFHGKQGLVLFGLSIVVLLFLAGIPMLGVLLFLGYFALAVIAAYRAYNGEMWQIPVIGIITSKIDLSKIPSIPLGSSEPVAPKTEAPIEPAKEETRKKEEHKHEEHKTKEEKK